MKLLVTLAIAAVCVAAEEKTKESLVRHKRGWGYETTTSGWKPPPPPPPTSGWTTESPGWNQPTTSGWSGWQQPQPQPNGWGWQGGGGRRYDYYNYGRYPRGGYYDNMPIRYRDTFGSYRSPYSRRQSSMY